MAESNPGTFGVTGRRIKPPRVDDDIEITLTLGDARRLHHIMHRRGFPDNPHNSIEGLRVRLLAILNGMNVNHEDLG